MNYLINGYKYIKKIILYNLIWLYTNYICEKTKDGFIIKFIYRNQICNISLKHKKSNYQELFRDPEIMILNEFELKSFVPKEIKMLDKLTCEFKIIEF